MIQGIHEPVRETDGGIEHPVEALQALAEHAFCPVAVRLELHAGLVFQFHSPLIAQREGHGQHAHELADAAALGHVRVLEAVAAPLQVAEEGFDAPARPIDRERLLAAEIVTEMTARCV